MKEKRGGFYLMMYGQFRYMKWFFLINLIIAILMGVSYFDNQLSVEASLWLSGVSSVYSAETTSKIFMYSSTQCVLALTFVMGIAALIQQALSYDARRAKLLASMPATQGQQLGAMVISAMLCYTIPLIVFTAISSVVYSMQPEIVREMMPLSPAAATLIEQDTIRTILAAVWKTWLCVTLSYLLVLMIAHLFGHFGMVLAVTVSFGWFLIWTVSNSYLFSNTLTLLRRSSLINALMDRGAEVQRTLLKYMDPVIFEAENIHGYDLWVPAASWSHIGKYTVIYGILIAICLELCRMMRKRLRVERLGSAFVFPAGKWIAVSYLVLWALVPPLTSFGTYRAYNTVGYNPAFPLSLIPLALLILVLAFIRKKKSFRARSAVSALLVLAICGSAFPARAEEQRITYDKQQLQNMIDFACGWEDIMDRRHQYYDVSEVIYDEYLPWDAEQLAEIKQKLSDGGLTEDDYRQIDSLIHRDGFADKATGTTADAFEENGFPKLAGIIRKHLASDYSDLEWEAAVERGIYFNVGYWDEWDSAKAVDISASPISPNILTAHADMMRNIEKHESLFREFVDVREDYEVAQYSFLNPKNNEFISWQSLQLIYQGGAFRHMYMLINRVNTSGHDAAAHAVKCVLLEEGVSAAEAEEFWTQVLTLLESKKDGQGTLKELRWTLDGRNGRLHVEAENGED